MGDFTRIRFRPETHNAGVRQQQGRVWLDSDWNEQAAIDQYYRETALRDLIGCCGVPKYGGGFRLTPIGGANPDLLIDPGRIYVHGNLYELLPGSDAPIRRHAARRARIANLVIDGHPLLVGQWVELFNGTAALGVARIDAIDGDLLTFGMPATLPAAETLRLRRVVSYYSQPDLPVPASALVAGSHYLAYLDLWQRPISAIEDPAIREVALGGPDTTTRLRTIAQVRLLPLPAGSPPPTCAALGRCWSPPGSDSTARLAARAEPDPEAADPCIVPARAGYRRLENQLYRVEIHTGSDDPRGPTFKWSRDNGSVIYAVSGVNVAQRRVTLAEPARDRYFSLGQRDMVELIDDADALGGIKRPLLQVDHLEENGTLVHLADTPAAAVGQDPTRHPLLRRWDHGRDPAVALVDGAIPVAVAEGNWFELEDGVEIFFEPGGSYQAGDYWTIPARTAIGDLAGDLLWPRDGAEPRLELREGTAHHYCALGVLQAVGDSWTLSDCRRIFPPLTEIDAGGCCVDVHPGDDLRQAIATVLAGGGGRVCLCAGMHTLTGTLDLHNAHRLTITGQGQASQLQLVADGGRSPAGIIVRGATQITFSDMRILADDAPALIAISGVGPSGMPVVTRDIVLRRMTLINSAVTERGERRCGIQLGEADTITIEECRIAAPIAILSLLGDQLPRPQEPPREEAVWRVDFADLAPDRSYAIGQTFESAGLSFNIANHTPLAGQPVVNGAAEVRAGDGSTFAAALMLGNAALSHTPTGRLRDVSAQFAHFGGSVSLRVNGEVRSFRTPESMNGITIGGVTVAVTTALLGRGRIGLLRLNGSIRDLALGGQELLLGEVTMIGAAERRTLPAYSGVTGLQLRHSTLRFSDAGIVALRAADWNIEQCDLRGVVFEPRVDADRRDQPGLRDADLFAPGVRGSRGVALAAWHWYNSRIDGCRIEARDGLTGWLWIGGRLSNTTVQIVRHGIVAGWLQAAMLNDNTIIEVPNRPAADPPAAGNNSRHAALSAAILLGGSHRARIERNTMRCASGVVNHTLADLLADIAGWADAVAGLYGEAENTRAALWLLLEDMVDLGGLTTLRDMAQELIDQLAASSVPVLWLAAEAIGDLLASESRLPFGNLALPQNALRISNNDIAAVAAIALRHFIPIGGLRIDANRLHAPAGQALRLQSLDYAANVQLNIFIWRSLMRSAPTALSSIERQIAAATGLPPAARTAALDLLHMVRRTLAGWAQQAEGWLEADYRVESNSLRSLRTAIESNLFELALVGNHITMQEQPIGNSGRLAIINALAGSRAFAPLAETVRRGAIRETMSYTDTIAADPDLMRTAAARRDLTSIAGQLGTLGDPALDSAAGDLSSAVAARDTAALAGSLRQIGILLANQFSGYGIALSGAGCRVLDNHVLVPTDTDPETWARGGMQIDIDTRQLFLALLFGDRGEADRDADLIGITETLVERNELIGGAGHGIEVRGDGREPAALFDLKVRANQVRGMAGAGILIEERLLVAGVDIEDNHIPNCSSVAGLAGLTDRAGGIVARNIFFGRIRGNRISNCGAGQQVRDMWGIDVDMALQLALNDNLVLNCGNDSDDQRRALVNGGIRILAGSGEIGIRACQILANHGLALRIERLREPDAITANRNESPLATMQLALFHVYLRRSREGFSIGGRPTVVLHASRLEAPAERKEGDLLGLISGMSDVQLNNNTIVGGALRIFGLLSGIISGNLASPGSILAQHPPAAANLIDGLNRPAIIRF